MCGFSYVLCVGLLMCYVWVYLCVMCGFMFCCMCIMYTIICMYVHMFYGMCCYICQGFRVEGLGFSYVLCVLCI